MSRPADSQLPSVGQNPVPLLLTEAGVESFQKVWLSGTVIAALFFGVSLLSSAIPGINEPHYLCKARAFDDPEWCTRDFFLASANAHYCFFAVTGFLTRWLSLDAIALLGRSVSVIQPGQHCICPRIQKLIATRLSPQAGTLDSNPPSSHSPEKLPSWLIVANTQAARILQAALSPSERPSIVHPVASSMTETDRPRSAIASSDSQRVRNPVTAKKQ